MGARLNEQAVVYRLTDLHVRGLLALLVDDDRLRVFVDRELAPLRTIDGDRLGLAEIAGL